jgi:BlaI family transcriptional regulator, penicillinase repressor
MTEKPPTPRRSVLDLAPLELDCMNTLWPMGEGTVRQIRDQLAGRRPRAYTTIMTIMDRLARKGVVERRKFGRAYIYRPNLSAEEARSQALGQVVENFFGGSREALLRQLNTSPVSVPAAPTVSLSAAAAAAGSSSAISLSAPRPAAILTMPSPQSAQEPRTVRSVPPPSRHSAPATPPLEPAPAESIDDTLL